MDSCIRLNLAQVLAVAWVWQTEVLPKFMPIWKEYGIACGAYRKPELHVPAYNALLDQLLSDARREDLKYTKGAMSMLAFNSRILIVFEPAMPFRRDDPKWNECVELLRREVPGRIIAHESLRNPPQADRREAKHLIRQLLSVDARGKLLYDSPLGGCMIFTPASAQ